MLSGRVALALGALVLAVPFLIFGASWALMKWDGQVWEDECRQVGGVVVDTQTPGGVMKGKLWACVRGSETLSWHHHS